MKRQLMMTVMVVGTMLLMVGCASLLPKESSATKSRWKTYSEVETAFQSITLDITDTKSLETLGFYPLASPNVKLLNYVDIMQIFMPNPAVRREDLPEAVRKCIDAREQSCGYQIDFENTKSRRYGNVFLDVFGFNRQTHVEGWKFRGLILVTNGTVVYKLSSGEPQIARDESAIHPLGPLQELDRVVFSVINVTR